MKCFIAYLFVLAIQYCFIFERGDLALSFSGALFMYLMYLLFKKPKLTIEQKLHKLWTEQLIKKLEEGMNKKLRKFK